MFQVRPRALAADAAGNAYVLGSFNASATICGAAMSTGGGSFDRGFVCSLDPAGQPRWVREIPGPAYFAGAVVDGPGHLRTVGSFTSTVDFDPGAGVRMLASAGSIDGFLLELDGAGSFVRAGSFGGPGSDSVFDVALDGSGGVLIAGRFSDTADLDPGAAVANLTSAGSYDAFVAKLDSAASLVWARGMGGAGSDAGSGVATTPLGLVTTAGVFEGSADFDPGAGAFLLDSAGSGDAFASTLDASGTFVRAVRFGGTEYDAAHGVLTTGGLVYVSGTFLGSVDFDPGPGRYLLSSTQQSVFFAKLDPAPCADGDQDGACGPDDNCPAIPNADQANADCDPGGDLCDPCVGDPAADADGDGACGTDCDDNDSATHPHAPEVNDGRDNQCPGDPGFGSADEISGAAGFHDPSDRNEYSWPPQPGATGYEVARSSVPNFGEPGTCAIVTASAIPRWIDPEAPPTGGVFCYLVRAATPFAGSWGTDGAGVEIHVSPCP